MMNRLAGGVGAGREGLDGGQAWWVLQRIPSAIRLIDRFALVNGAVVHTQGEKTLAVCFGLDRPMGCGAKTFQCEGGAIVQLAQ